MLSNVLILVVLCAGLGTGGRSDLRLSTNPQVATRPQTPASPQIKADGDWQGILDAGGAKLRLIVHITRKDTGYSATMDSPDQGALGFPIDMITVADTSVRFEVKPAGVVYVGNLSGDASQIEGKLSQRGLTFPLTFKRVERTVGPDLQSRKIDAGGHNLNMLIGGEGSPAVILEGGFGEGIGGWSLVQKEIAGFAQTVSYDRAGLGQSDPGPKPRTAKQIATELHTALQHAGIKPPYVLVGHSMGGPYIRVFADLYPQEVAGMVLVDPAQEDFEVWLKAHPDPKEKEEEAQIAKAPEGIRAEWDALDAAYAQARVANLPAGIPVTLISATKRGDRPEWQEVFMEKQTDWLARVPGGKHVLAEKSGHFVQVQQPEVVIDAIKEMVTRAR